MNIPPVSYAAALLTLYILFGVISAAQVQPTPPSAAPPAGHKLPEELGWTFKKAPDYCHALVARPTWAKKDCRMNHETLRCKDGSYQMFSQMKQDYYLYTHHFVHLKRRGIYADVATNDPIGISNSFFFEKCLGWSGLCVEANPQYLAKIHRHRNCALVPTCVSDWDGKAVEFVLKSALSGVKDTNKNLWKWTNETKEVPTVKQICSTLGREVERYNVNRIDYLSLDVEGHELHVLKGIDWNKLIINVITLEPNAKTARPIEQFLTLRGYIRHTPHLDEQSVKSRSLGGDMVFLYRDVVFGKPV